MLFTLITLLILLFTAGFLYFDNKLRYRNILAISNPNEYALDYLPILLESVLLTDIEYIKDSIIKRRIGSLQAELTMKVDDIKALNQGELKILGMLAKQANLIKANGVINIVRQHEIIDKIGESRLILFKYSGEAIELQEEIA